MRIGLKTIPKIKPASLHPSLLFRLNFTPYSFASSHWASHRDGEWVLWSLHDVLSLLFMLLSCSDMGSHSQETVLHRMLKYSFCSLTVFLLSHSCCTVFFTGYHKRVASFTAWLSMSILELAEPAYVQYGGRSWCLLTETIPEALLLSKPFHKTKYSKYFKSKLCPIKMVA